MFSIDFFKMIFTRWKYFTMIIVLFNLPPIFLNSYFKKNKKLVDKKTLLFYRSLDRSTDVSKIQLRRQERLWSNFSISTCRDKSRNTKAKLFQSFLLTWIYRSKMAKEYSAGYSPCIKCMKLACWVLHGHFGTVDLLQLSKHCNEKHCSLK